MRLSLGYGATGVFMNICLNPLVWLWLLILPSSCQNERTNAFSSSENICMLVSHGIESDMQWYIFLNFNHNISNVFFKFLYGSYLVFHELTPYFPYCQPPKTKTPTGIHMLQICTLQTLRYESVISIYILTVRWIIVHFPNLKAMRTIWYLK